MRFYVPNMEEQEEEPVEREGEGKEEKPADEANQEEDEEEITPAKVFNDLILKYAGLGDSAGDIVASFHDLPLQVPRGKYTLDMFQAYAKFHGRTHDYKIIYKDIIKVFQLPRVDRDQMVILIQLSKPLTQGQTMHHFIMI
jgi:structure-specific recognition protein 1